MTEDFYCDETENVLAYYHTKPFYPVHIVAIPKNKFLLYYH